MCNQKVPFCHTAKLYSLFKQSIERYLLDISLPAIKSQMSGAYLVREFVSQWDDHLLISRWMCNFFYYVNRFYVKRGRDPTLKEVCTDAFRDHIFRPVQEKLTSTVLKLILIDREQATDMKFSAAIFGHLDNDIKDRKALDSFNSSSLYRGVDVKIEGSRRLLQRAIEVYIAMDTVKLKIYKETLETQILQESAIFYTARCAQQLANLDCPNYLIHAEADIARELMLVKQVFHYSTKDGMLEVLRSKLLVERQEEIMQRPMGVMRLLVLGKNDDLARLYRLYAPCGHRAIASIANVLKNFIQTKGSEIISEVKSKAADKRKKYDQIVMKLVELHKACYELVEKPLSGNPIFHKALKEAFEFVINHKLFNSSLGEMLAERIDILLRKGLVSKGMSHKDIAEEVSQLIALFCYLSDKDKFAEYYRLHFAERLLQSKSISMDMEKLVIGKLKYSCGAQFTAKIEGMLNDAKNAHLNDMKFETYIAKRRMQRKETRLLTELGGTFGARVLTSGFWPTMQEEHVGLPRAVTATLGEYETFYERLYGKRRLKWIHSLATVTIETVFNHKLYEFCMNGFQAAVLLALNEYPNGTSIENLLKETLLPAATMKRVLLSLVLKSKILQKKPRKDYKASDLIFPNTSFNSPKRRLRIPSHQGKENKRKTQKVMAKVSEDRKGALESAIVRVLKIRKTIDHQSLVQEVTKMVLNRNQFRAEPKQIKQRIESLMEREYLERDTNNAKIYHYCA
mmetsp:Transcript_24216/g.36311  ORF Transcript_24216/g.36311 Transcript_24216/m.36311 type:complete len:740 (+) Transcript_24216:262-2481(+)